MWIIIYTFLWIFIILEIKFKSNIYLKKFNLLNNWVIRYYKSNKLQIWAIFLKQYYPSTNMI